MTMVAHRRVAFAWMSVAVFATLGATPFARAQPCADCGQSDWAEASAFLAEQGYSEQDYEVLFVWQERTRFGPNTMVTGYHIRELAAGIAFDLYSASGEGILDGVRLAALGIPAKNWDLAPIERQTEWPAAIEKALPVRPMVVSAGWNAPCLALPALDVQALRDEDERSQAMGAKTARRVGVVRVLSDPIRVTGQTATLGSWRTLQDGRRVWSATLASPEANAIRIHFAAIRLPKGATVALFNPDSPAEAYGPYERPSGSESDLWSASCFADSVSIECALPGNAGSAPVSLEIVIDRIAHTYEDFGNLSWAKSAGACNLDVSCYPEWAEVARAVGAFTFISQLNQLHCTGTLIADLDSTTDVPYFLTANHCVSVQDGSSGASSMEFYWLYQTSECGGAAPRLADMPRTSGGADLLATRPSSSGTDFALVRLRNAPPSELPFAGWSSAPVAVGTNVVAIHHPSGDYKRISFGTLTNSGSPANGGLPVKPYDYFLESLWQDGTTEHGSSGCPLLLEDRQLVVGQLWGGYASCYLPNEPDYFGRFDKSFPLIEPWLSPESNPKDIDESGAVNAIDLQLAVNAVLGIPIQYDADVNRSGKVDAVDIQLIIVAVLNAGSV